MEGLLFVSHFGQKCLPTTINIKINRQKNWGIFVYCRLCPQHGNITQKSSSKADVSWNHEAATYPHRGRALWTGLGAGLPRLFLFVSLYVAFTVSPHSGPMVSDFLADKCPLSSCNQRFMLQSLSLFSLSLATNGITVAKVTVQQGPSDFFPCALNGYSYTPLLWTVVY